MSSSNVIWSIIQWSKVTSFFYIIYLEITNQRHIPLLKMYECLNIGPYCARVHTAQSVLYLITFLRPYLCHCAFIEICHF